jgi:hypothetical protein
LVTELLSLPKLVDLTLSWNALTGTLVPEMAKLTTLELQENRLTGSLPALLFTPATALRRFHVGANALTGTIPVTISLATQLIGLFLFDNAFSGSIPGEIGQLPLQFFRIQGNMLTGSLPLTTNNINWLTTLQELWLHRNAFTGTIPMIVGSILPLLDLRLGDNQLTGTIPGAIYNLSQLFRLSLRNNEFSGSMSSRIGLLTNLEIVELQFNALTGTVPERTCDLERLTNLEADCLPTANNPPNPCTCCTMCCNRQSLVCQGGPAGSGIVTDEQKIAQFQNYIRNIFGNGIDLSSPSNSSPHDKAIRWMALDDFQQLAPVVDATFLQRYVMVLFYYQTGPWRSCNPGVTTSCFYQEFGQDDDGTIVYRGTPATRWLSGTSECEWVGVVCALGVVVGIDLCT